MTRKFGFAIARATPRRLEVILTVVAAVGCAGEVGDHGSATTPQPQGKLPATDLPCEVQTVLSTRCWTCHGQTPLVGVPSLTSVAAFMAPSRLDQSQSTGAVAVARMQSPASPMPPPPATPATTAEI